MDRPWQLCVVDTSKFSKLKLLSCSLKYVMETSSCGENPYWGCKYFFDSGFFFLKVSIVMNKVLHLKCCCYFSLVMTTASSYMIAALQKRSHKKIKGEMVGKPHQGWPTVWIMGLFSLRSKLLFCLLNSSFLLPSCVDKPETTSREKCAIDFQTRH